MFIFTTFALKHNKQNFLFCLFFKSALKIPQRILKMPEWFRDESKLGFENKVKIEVVDNLKKFF